MDAALLNQSNYIKSIEFKGRDVTLTIAGVKLEDLEDDKNVVKRKGVVYFVETKKGWIVNVTNTKALIAMFGRETDNWVGKKVTLFPEANSQSESGFAIRVRGSPDLPKDVTFTLKLARKSPREVTLKALGKNGKANGKAAPATSNSRAAAPPPQEPEPREPGVPDDEPPPSDPNEPPLFADEGEQPRA
jgi:hypothetical protein